MPPSSNKSNASLVLLVAIATAASTTALLLFFHHTAKQQQRRRRRSLAMRGLTRAQVLAHRLQYLSPNLSLSFSSSNNPLCIVEGQGCYLYDSDNKTVILDCVNNVAHVAHSHPRLAAVAAHQLQLINTNTRYLCPTRGMYAKKLLATFPPPLQDGVVLFVNSGSEANDLALRMARTYTQGAMDTIVLAAAYHGHTAALIEVSPYKYEGKGGFAPPSYVHKVSAPDTYRGIHRGPDSGEKYAAEIKRVCEALQTEGHRRRVGAFLAESVLGCGGQLVLPPGYLSAAYKYVREAGGVCIADEVQVGFGRVGTHMWAFQTQGEDVCPDIVTLGKPMGNGLALGAVVVRREIAEAFNNGMEYFNTFGGSNLSCAIGEAVLDIIQEEGLQENARVVGDYLKMRLQTLQETTHPTLIGDVRGLGLFLGIELVKDPVARTPWAEAADWVAGKAKEFGVQVSTDGPDKNVLKIKPPLCFGKKEADLLVAALDTAMSEFEREQKTKMSQ